MVFLISILEKSMGVFMCLLMSILSLLFFNTVVFFVGILLRLVTPVIQRQARAHFTWRLGSQFLGGTAYSDKPKLQLCDVNLSVVRYQSETEGLNEIVECVFCLSDIEDGEEIRELRCRHLFHRSCLDKWLMHQRATCPLCRDALVPPAAAAKCGESDVNGDEEEEEEEVHHSYMLFPAYAQSGWWSW